MNSRPIRTSRWLAHHGPEHLERCTVVAGHHVCRRCAVLYPIAAVTWIAAGLLLGTTLPGWATLAMWALPVAMVADWIAEHLGLARWSPRRQIAVTAFGAPALGLALAAHAAHPFTAAAVAPVVTWSAACLAVAIVGAVRRGPDEDWAVRHEVEEERRAARLAALVGDV